jgi:hypothetical protein
MPGHLVAHGETGGRREGRRSLAAYRSNARGGGIGPSSSERRKGSAIRTRGRDRLEPGATSAGIALALIYPLLKIGRRVLGFTTTVQQRSSQGAGCMKRKPTIKSLQTVSLDEALAYLDHANGDELDAAYALASDRNRLDGSAFPPDDAEIHHACFLLCRARGLLPPSFDAMRVELRRRAAA